MNGDQTDDNGARPGRPAAALGQPVERGGSARRTVILRIGARAVPEALIPDIAATGATVVSEGAGVIVVEATPEQIENLLRHESIIAADEPRRYQMRPTLR